jgi:hypothetical protein
MNRKCGKIFGSRNLSADDHKSMGRKVSGMVEAVPRSVGVSWSSGSYSVKSTAKDEADVGSEPQMKAE